MACQSIDPPIPQESPLDRQESESNNASPSYCTEGPLLLQLIFQNLNGAPLLDELIQPTVNLILQKFIQRRGTLSKTVKRLFILVILSCILQNTEKTMEAIYGFGCLPICQEVGLTGEQILEQFCSSLTEIPKAPATQDGQS